MNFLSYHYDNETPVMQRRKTKSPWAYCIKLLPEKTLWLFQPEFFSYGKVNGKFMLTGIFRFYQSFFSGTVLCNRPLVSLNRISIKSCCMCRWRQLWSLNQPNLISNNIWSLFALKNILLSKKKHTKNSLYMRYSHQGDCSFSIHIIIKNVLHAFISWIILGIRTLCFVNTPFYNITKLCCLLSLTQQNLFMFNWEVFFFFWGGGGCFCFFRWYNLYYWG